MNRYGAWLAVALIAIAACARTPAFPEGGTTAESGGASRLVVIGDFGAGHPGQYEVATALEMLAETDGFDALVTVGDNFYTDDIDAIWLEPYGWLIELGIPIHAAWGNHDVDTPQRTELVSQHLGPPYWWYTVELGDATLVFLDTNQIDSEEQQSWLEQTLAETNDLVVAVTHFPVFSCGEHGSTASLIDRWAPLFEQYGVDLVLSGHEHSYERTAVGDVDYIVSGGGGMPIRAMGTCPAGTPPPIAANDSDHHYLLMEIGGGQIAVTAFAVDGSVIDEVLIADG